MNQQDSDHDIDRSHGGYLLTAAGAVSDVGRRSAYPSPNLVSACSGGIDNGLTFARGVALTTVAAVSALRALSFTSVGARPRRWCRRPVRGKKQPARVRETFHDQKHRLPSTSMNGPRLISTTDAAKASSQHMEEAEPQALLVQEIVERRPQHHQPRSSDGEQTAQGQQERLKVASHRWPPASCRARAVELSTMMRTIVIATAG